MVVQDYYSGSCHIKINDEYCKEVTKDQIEEIAQRIGRIYRESEIRRVQMGKNK